MFTNGWQIESICGSSTMSFVMCRLLFLMMRRNDCWKRLRIGSILQWDTLLGRYVWQNVREFCAFRSHLLASAHVTHSPPRVAVMTSMCSMVMMSPVMGMNMGLPTINRSSNHLTPFFCFPKFLEVWMPQYILTRYPLIWIIGT